MNKFHFVILDIRGNESHFYWNSEYETSEEVYQEIYRQYGQLPLFVERIK